MRCLLIAFAILILSEPSAVRANETAKYVQLQDVIYAEVHGTGLLMDIFTPTGPANGLAIVDVASGAWFSDRGKIRDHSMAQVYSIFCERGYVVFAVRPGSKTRYTALEMDQHVKLAIRHVKDNAKKYQIDADKLGLTGASAGGHLACLAALTPVEAQATSKNSVERQSSAVAAVAVFFPPTDFIEWHDGKMVDPKVLGPLLFVGADSTRDGQFAAKTSDELREMAKAISPLYQVKNPRQPFLFIHGDADRVVPLSHSEKLVKAINAAGGSAELVVKEGGGHPWLTIPIDVGRMADWFDKQLE